MVDEKHNNNNQPEIEENDFLNFSNFEEYFELRGELAASGFGDYIFSGENESITNNNVDESGSASTNTTDPLYVIDQACHYWDHTAGWKIFLYFNFFVMFILPFCVSGLQYSLCLIMH